MRGTFVRGLVELAAVDPRVLFLTGDLGYSVVEPLAERFPDRFFNVGVAEQNMIGLATGLADGGFIPYAYSIATFAALRPFEFIRNGPVLHRLPVRIVGVGGGFDYGSAGPTHHAVEDIAVLRTLPGLAIVSPADHEQAGTALVAMHDNPGPVYFRLGKDERRTVPGLSGAFRVGRLEVLMSGSELAIVTAGSIAHEAACAADELRTSGTDVTLAVAACISPAPVDDLTRILAQVPVAVVVENHSVTGGLGSLVCEVVAERGLHCRVVRCGAQLSQGATGGGESFLNSRAGLSARSICHRARDAIGWGT